MKSALGTSLSVRTWRQQYANLLLLYLQRLPRSIVNAPAKLIFPAGGKLLKAGNSRSYAMNALRPYLKKVHSIPAT